MRAKNEDTKIRITSYNGEASVKLNFTIAGKVVGVVLDREVIVF